MSEVTDPTELDELESGLTSGFWQRFTAHVNEEWGPAGQTYQEAVKRAISGGVGTEAEAIHRLKNVAYAQAAILALLKWPHERVTSIKQSVERQRVAGGPSRRGPGL